MSEKRLRQIGRLCQDVAIAASWSQWNALGAPVSAQAVRPTVSVIDPEALLLLSLDFRHQERRLEDVLEWWAKVASRLISIQRLRAMLRYFPKEMESEVARFAGDAYEAGDGRWRSLASVVKLERNGRRRKGLDSPAFGENATLLVRLRRGFGVGVKSDILGLLLGLNGSKATVREMRLALLYSKMSISQSAQEMARAKIIQKTGERPTAYFLHTAHWEEILGFGPSSSVVQKASPPVWRYWFQLFCLLTSVSHWTRKRLSDGRSNYVLSSEARDLFYAHNQSFTLNGITVQDPEQYKGEDYLDGFCRSLEQMATWVDENL